MAEDRFDEHFAPRDIPFVPMSGYVGMGTLPGVAAEPVVALRLDAQSYLFDGTQVESIWVKAIRHGKDPAAQDGEEYLMFASRAEELEPVVAALAEAAIGRMRDEGRVIPGRYSGYHNRAQVEAGDVTEECVEGLSAEVRRGVGDKGIELVLRDAAQRKDFELHSRPFSPGGSDRAVMRLSAAFEPAAVTELLSEFVRLKEWQAQARRDMDAHLEAQPSAPRF